MPTLWESQVSSLSPTVWYKFDGTGTPTDSGSAATTATLVGTAPTYSQAGVSGTSYFFNGATRYELTSFPANTLDDKVFTVEAIFKFNEQTSNTFPTIFRATNGNSNLLMRSIGSGSSSGTGKMETYFSTSTGAYILQYSANRVDDGMWHHAAIISDGTNVRLMLDGIQEWSVAVPAGSLSLDNAGYRAFGRGDPTGEFMIGNIDEVVIYGSALTNTQIYNNLKTVFKTRAEIANIGSYSTKPVWYFPFDETSTSDRLYNIGSTNVRYLDLSATATRPTTGINVNYVNFGSNFAGYDTTGAWNMPTAWSMSFWYKRASAPTGNPGWFNWYYNSGVFIDYTRAYISNDGKLHFNPYLGSAGTDLVSTNSVSDNTWHHIGITRNGSTIKLYVDGTLNQTATNHGTAAGYSASMGFGFASTDWDEFMIYHAELSAANISTLYQAGITAVNVSYTAAVATVSTSTFPMPVVSGAANYTHTVSTATTTAVDPTVSAIRSPNIDGGGVFTATATMVNSTVVTTKNIDYAASAKTASATMPSATATATKSVEVSASPSTASALLSARVFAGDSVQDTSYSISIRRITATTNSTGNSGFIIGATRDNNIVTQSNSLALKANSGYPAYNKIIKAKFDPTHVSVITGGDNTPANYFKVYVFTEDPSTSFDTMTFANLPAKEYLFTTRLVDDGSYNQFYLDLTQALTDIRAHTYGIYIEIDLDTIGGSPTGTYYDRTEWTGSNLNNQLLYTLTSDYISAGQNAAVTTAEALMPMPVATVQRYVNIEDGIALVTALMAMPAITTEKSNSISALPMTASALSPAALFTRTVEYQHAHAEAFGALPMPTFFAYGTITFAATPLTASALFHEPQANIGEDNIVASMDASATMPGGIVVLSSTVTAMTTTVTADIVTPAVQGQLLGRVQADAMKAGAFSPAPPAFISKNDDLWFSTLRAQNVVNVPPNANSLLKLFNDVNANITPPDINNTYYYNQSGIYDNKKYNSDIPGYTGAAVTLVAALWSNSNQTGALAPTPLLETGYFDNQNRRAVRFRNICMGSETRNTGITGSNYSYTAEYIIKTDKQNQIIAHGYSDNPSVPYYSGRQSSIGLYNGKVYVSNNFTGTLTNIHPLNTALGTDATTNIATNGYWTIGNKNIADGNWHHLTIQVESNTARVQIWIDGSLDIQRYNFGNQLPYELGYNSALSTYSSDFYLSGYSVKPNTIIDTTSILTHYYASINYIPIKAAPMVASAIAPVNSTAKGNRARALMLYWFPVAQEFNRTADDGSEGPFDYETFANLYTTDYINNPPQQYYGWDVFPVDIQGYYVSDIANLESYGGVSNVETITLNNTTNKVKINRRGYFRDPLTDNRRYIDLLNDLDLSQFDAIFFRNFPDQPLEQQQYSTTESVDPYFGIIEKEIYEKFLVGLRAAVDTGISLYVTNTQLAIDLGIVDRVEIVESLADTAVSDEYAPTIAPSPQSTNNGQTPWIDNHFNNRIMVKNVIEDLTDFPTTIWTDAVFWKNNDAVDFGGADSESLKYDFRPNGLNLGDVMLMSDIDTGGRRRLLQATPIANIKAGRAVTTFAPTIRRGLTEVDNPYKNHAVHIAVAPGDVLNGKQLGGKIFVSFTEIFPEAQGYLGQDTYYFSSRDHGQAELIQDKWINVAYEQNAITLAQKNLLLASEDNLDRQLEAAIAENNSEDIANINRLKYWDINGDNILGQQNANITYMMLQSNAAQSTQAVNKNNINDGATGTTVAYSKEVFFTFKYSRKYPMFTFQVPSMMTRGFWWISKRLVPEGQIQRPVAVTASTELVMPVVTADRILSFNATAMTASAGITYPTNYSSKDANIVSLPMYVNGIMTNPTKLVLASPMTASATLKTDITIQTSSTDEIVMYIYHTDPILYLREEVIK